MKMSLNLKVRMCEAACNLLLTQPSIANGKILLWVVTAYICVVSVQRPRRLVGFQYLVVQPGE